ncbi:MAG: alanine--glyoxylate aminotransferase family protein [Nanoarchaeota archaeon]|mgnify:CR=1 FL=1
MAEKTEKKKQIKKSFRMFTAGPVNVTDTVKQSLAYPEMGHREPEFEKLYEEVRKKLLRVFGVDTGKYNSFVIGGSGTAAMESVISAMVHRGRKMLVINNGAFGDRISEICDVYGIPTLKTGQQWGEYPKFRGIENLLLQEPDIEAVSMVFMETSTGMVNPVREVGELCKKYGKMFAIDAISGFAGDHLDIEESGVDFVVSNTNKGVSGLPVISFALVKKSAVEKIRDIPERSYYLSLLKHLKYAEKNQTPFTPQIPLFFMLNQALEELLEEGVENRHKRYRENSILMRQRLKELGFRFQLPEEQMSNVMTNVLVPGNYKYEEFHAPLKKKGYIIYPGKGPLEGKVLHIANVGTHTTKDVGGFCDALAKIVEKKKVEYLL